jgi:cytochrome c-type biogenesis protein
MSIAQSLLTSVFFGLLATASPCVLPLYPGFLAYLSGSQDLKQPGKSRYFLGFCVLLGVLSMMLLLGAVIAGLSISIGRALAWFIPAADVIIMILGILLVANINPFVGIPQIRSPLFKHPLLNAYLYGLLYGPLTLPCSGPLVVGIFAYSFTAQEAASKLVVFLGFGLGFGLPLFALSIVSAALQHRLVTFFARHSRVINLVGGCLLLTVGLLDLISNWPMLITYWGLHG